MGRAENIVGKGENAGDQHNVFKKHFSVGLLKVVLVWQRVEDEQIKIICKVLLALTIPKHQTTGLLVSLAFRPCI